MSVSQVTDEVLYTGLIEMQELPELYSSQSDTLQEVKSPILVKHPTNNKLKAFTY